MRRRFLPSSPHTPSQREVRERRLGAIDNFPCDKIIVHRKRELFADQMDDELAREVNTKPFIPTNNYQTKILDVKEGKYSDKWKGGLANMENLQVTFQFFDEDGEMVGRLIQDMLIETRSSLTEMERVAQMDSIQQLVL